MATLVYNRDFAEDNFGEQLKGIFTLGEDATKSAEKIERLQGEIGKLDREIDGLKRNLRATMASVGGAKNFRMRRRNWKKRAGHRAKAASLKKRWLGTGRVKPLSAPLRGSGKQRFQTFSALIPIRPHGNHSEPMRPETRLHL